MGDRLLDFVGDPANATFGCSGEMRDNISSSPDPGVQGKKCPWLQGRRCFLKSGTAIERHRRSASSEGSSGGRAREGVIPPLVRGVRGISPEKFFEFNMSVEAILMHFDTIFAWEIRLIVQAFHVAVFKCVWWGLKATAVPCLPCRARSGVPVI